MPIFRKDGKNILFIHIPKTGGSAIEAVFRNSGYQEDFHDGKTGPGTLNYLRHCTPQHMHGRLLWDTFQLGRFDLIFMVVRDPLARFRSEYLWRNRETGIQLDVESIERWGNAAFGDYGRNPYIFDNHFRPQFEFHVPHARVFRFEDGLDEVVRRLNADHGLALEETVPRERTGEGETGVSSRDVAIPPALERRLRRFYYEDFHLFGYAAGAGSVSGARSFPPDGGELAPLPRGGARAKIAWRRSRRRARTIAVRLFRSAKRTRDRG